MARWVVVHCLFVARLCVMWALWIEVGLFGVRAPTILLRARWMVVRVRLFEVRALCPGWVTYACGEGPRASDCWEQENKE